MIEIRDSSDHTVVSNEIATGIFGNCLLGNVDPRFGPVDEIEANRLRALQILMGHEAVDKSSLIVMEPTGKQGFTDLNTDSNLKTDGLITTDPSVVISGNPADCEMVGMFGYGENQPVLGLIHVGREIAEHNGHVIALEYLVDNYGLSPQDTQLVFAPSIKAASYKFPDIKDEQKEAPEWAPYIHRDDDGLWHVDVHQKVVDELHAQGVPAENIYESPVDVGADPNYFSHRQYIERGQTRGRNAVLFTLNPI
jgi:copper oxidase (laccase) domain-containing protein